MVTIQVPVRPTAVTRVLLAVVVVLALVSVGFQIAARLTGHPTMLGLVRLFNVDEEGNVPSLYSWSLLATASVLSAAIFLLKRAKADPFATHWAVLAVGFLLMSIDEAVAIHELLIAPLRQLLHAGGVLHNAWVVPALVLVLVLALYFYRFLLRLPASTRRAFLWAAALYLGGAVGLEMVDGLVGEMLGQKSMVYVYLVTVEETLEMVGVIVFIQALLQYVLALCAEARFEFVGSAD